MIGRFASSGIYRELAGSRDFARAMFAGGLALVSWIYEWQSGEASAISMALALASLIMNGAPIVVGAVRGLIRREVNVDELVSLAIAGSVFQGEFLTAAVVSFVMVFGSLIEQATSGSARKAIEALISIAPDIATVIRDTGPVEIKVSEVKVGDVLLIRAGERIPVDAEILKGVTAVDESAMTGEPSPVEKAVGDFLFAGTLNQNGVLEAVASKVGDDTTLGRVIRLVTEAEAYKPHTVRIIDRYAQWFTPLILLCAILTWVLTGEFDRAVTVLIVGCPCALILAAPTAIVAALGRAAREGVLVKGGQFLEEAARASVVLFDKTGTLTEGKPRVDCVVPYGGADRDEILALAASVERHSTHPLAHAVLCAAREAGLTIPEADEMQTEVGLGVRAFVQGSEVKVGSTYLGGGSMSVPSPLREELERVKAAGSTPLVVYRDGTPLGLLGVADHVRPEAAQAVTRLQAAGITKIGILSGDHEAAARRIADEAGIQNVWASLKPDQKLEVIRQEQAAGRSVMFVGDGINDAPALAAANVGVAMGGAGTDVALETADIVLMHDNLRGLYFLVRLGRRMVRVIKWNITFGVTFNAIAVLASGAGYLSPIMGAIVHNIGSVLVVLCAASLALHGNTPDDQPVQKG